MLRNELLKFCASHFKRGREISSLQHFPLHSRLYSSGDAVVLSSETFTTNVKAVLEADVCSDTKPSESSVPATVKLKKKISKSTGLASNNRSRRVRPRSSSFIENVPKSFLKADPSLNEDHTLTWNEICTDEQFRRMYPVSASRSWAWSQYGYHHEELGEDNNESVEIENGEEDIKRILSEYGIPLRQGEDIQWTEEDVEMSKEVISPIQRRYGIPSISNLSASGKGIDPAQAGTGTGTVVFGFWRRCPLG